MIHVQHLTKTYDDLSRGKFVAVDRISFSVQPGEIFGLLGPNGAGKTTLISIIAGLAKASGGQVAVNGFDVQKQYRKARQSLGVVPQELVFDPFFDVRETLRLSSGYYGIKRNDDWIDELLANLGLSDKADANMRSLSGGMKRRVLVAQALVHKPPVIVLDEPTAGVDVELRQTLWRFIGALNRQGHTIVLTTHYLEEAEELCNRIAMLKSGEIVALEKTSSLLGNFASRRLNLKISGGQWPDQLTKFAVHGAPDDNGRVELRLDSFDSVESMLGTIRAAGYAIEEMEVGQADLEDVFVSMMGEQ